MSEANATAETKKAASAAQGEKTGGKGGAKAAPVPTVSDIFGQAVWLMTQSPVHRNFFLSDLEWMVMPPLLLRQFRIFPGKNQPIGLALWGKLTEDAEKRLMTPNARLAPQDWNAGDRLWLVELLAPFGHQDVMLADLQNTIFAGKSFKMIRTVNGQREVATLEGAKPGEKVPAPTVPAESNGEAPLAN